MKKEKGITLVALIITIVIMLILVAVSFNILVNSNLIGHSEKIGEAYTGAIKNEEKLGNDGVTINEEMYDSLKDYLAHNKSSLGNHNWEIEEDTLTCAHCNKTYTIGQKVNYKATGKGSTTIKAAISGCSEDQTITIDSETQWVVLGAKNTDNDENGTNETLLITTEKPTTKTIYFYGAAAYNNCIDEINRMCRELYGENARGMTIEDVNNCLQYTPAGGIYYDTSDKMQTWDSLEKTLKELPLEIWNAIKNNHKTPDGLDTETALGEYPLDAYWYSISTTEATEVRKNLILASNVSYWLASRGVGVYARRGCAIFGPGAVCAGDTGAYGGLYASNGSGTGYSFGLRPVVSLTTEI